MFNTEQIKNAMPERTFEVFSEGFSDLNYINRWTLVGGTALSIYYHHRLSEDLDFFIEKSTLDQERKYIQSIINDLEDKGFHCIQTKDENENIDYDIEDVKVTFYASGLKNLKDNCAHCNNIDVASINTIIVMKMNAIINYRTKTRDFYDVYTIAKHENITLFHMLDHYKRYNNHYVNDAFILNRLTTRLLDKDDEGLETMDAKGLSEFTQLRKWFIKEIKQGVLEDITCLQDIEKDSTLIDENKERCFGLERLSLLQKFATLGKDNMVIKCLEHAMFDMSYTNTANKNILDYYLEDNDMFQLLLTSASEIPEEWMNKNRSYKNARKLPMIQLENSIVNCAKNECNEKRMHINAEKFEIDHIEYTQRVNNKRDLFKEIEYKKFVKRNATLTESLEEDETLLDGLDDA